MRERYLLLLLAVACIALQVQPQTITVDGGPGTDFSHVVTVTNDGPRPLDISIEPHEFSEYLEGSTSLSKEQFSLEPFASANLQVIGTVPPLGPEEHRLVYELSDEGALGNITLLMPIAGTPKLHPKVTVSVDDSGVNEPVVAHLTIFNFGNVIAYYDLEMTVRRDGETIGTMRYPRTVQVLPGEERKVDLLYTDALEPGTYEVEVKAGVNDQQVVEASAPFRTTIKQTSLEISAGEALTVRIDRRGEDPRVSYTVSAEEEVLLQDTQTALSDELEIPTARLQPGDYRVRITVHHQQGEDTTELDLRVDRRGPDRKAMALLIAAVIMGGLLGMRPVRLYLRIAYVSWRVRRAERALNRLVARAHRIVQ